jgi:magnesium and cobalt transporter
MLHQASAAHILDQNTVSMMEHVLEVEETKVNDVMIPRTQMICLEQTWNYQKVTQAVTESGHSRLPVLGENRDEVIGILLAKDLLGFAINNQPSNFNLHDLIRPVSFIPETKRLHALLQEFRRNRNHLAIVVDEYGRITGLITIEDVLEEIVGEIEDEHDTEDEQNIRLQQDGQYLIRALTTLDEFNKFFDSKIEVDGVDTVGGLLMRSLGRMPKRGESVEIDRYKFTVLRADSRRIYALAVNIL